MTTISQYRYPSLTDTHTHSFRYVFIFCSRWFSRESEANEKRFSVACLAALSLRAAATLLWGAFHPAAVRCALRCCESDIIQWQDCPNNWSMLLPLRGAVQRSAEQRSAAVLTALLVRCSHFSGPQMCVRLLDSYININMPQHVQLWTIFSSVVWHSTVL